MAAQDATMYWLSSRTRNDLFLLYCFADRGRPSAELRAAVAERSARIPDLRVRARAVPGDLDYPSWVPCAFADDQFVEHALAEPDWAHLQVAVGAVVGTGVDAAVRPWRLHVFRGIADAPGSRSGPALVVVLQMSHALADGRRAARIARALFTEEDDAASKTAGGATPASRLSGADVAAAVDVKSGSEPWDGAARSAPVTAAVVWARSVEKRIAEQPPMAVTLALSQLPIRLASTVIRGYRAFRAQRELAELTTAGELPPPGPDFPSSLINRPGPTTDSDHQVRMIVCAATELRVPGRTVTVVVLTAVSLALARYLEGRGAPVERLGAQVPMALDADESHARNNYRSLSVDLFIDEPELHRRADKIAATLADRRRRAQHPLLTAQDRVTAVVPAPLLRRDIARYPLDTVPDSIAGHTVVSSVHRGPADLTFGGGPVRFTGGFPAVGAVMRLTHGVHGLGETVTISLHADAEILPDIDAYAELLRAALAETVHSLK
ncbi:wax ester/triacylglycerol synthase domain-containing protein [Nocardia suismassiliense]|uniref:wax ester/triacylglycerol synthase domain-containing protein n=1 Tax=Nocardia suismassiliense TaxID=2077092 RepID=UPI000D1DE8C0|nr:wax ester/triacylglycerol synthase domain-containing protein [Nocardia suismassiliense]